MDNFCGPDAFGRLGVGGQKVIDIVFLSDLFARLEVAGIFRGTGDNQVSDACQTDKGFRLAAKVSAIMSVLKISIKN